MSKFPYPENPAPTDAPLLDAIKRRWSPLAFSDEPIDEEKIKSLFEAIRWTQSSRNEQPWRVVYATKDNPEEFDKISSLLTPDNAYAKDAYLLMAIFAVPTFVYKDKPNLMHRYDTGAAIHSLFIQAVSLDLVAHQMGGFDKEKVFEVLNVPTNMVPLVMMAVGYPGDESKIDPEKLKSRYAQHQDRKDLNEIVFKGKWQ